MDFKITNKDLFLPPRITEFDMSANVVLYISKSTVFPRLPDPWTPRTVRELSDKVDVIEQMELERLFDSSVMHHSTMYKRSMEINSAFRLMRRLHPEKFAFLDDYIFDPGESRLFRYGRIEKTRESRVIYISENNSIELRNNGIIIMHSTEYLPGDLVFEKGKRITSEEMPYFDFLLTLGIKPEYLHKTCQAIDVTDTISEEGGSFEIKYIVEIDCFEAERTELIINAYPLDSFSRELSVTDIKT